ncbi:MAG: hypothetical protein H0W90_16430 [Actinobacteria bacterium]|nr:hypothetical protein [Actinomycetota bacterium]
MTTRTKVTLAVLALLTAVAVGSVLATRTHASERAHLSQISNEGHHVALQHGSAWRGFGLTSASLLGVRGARAVYRLESKGGPCVGAGPADDPGKLGTVDCPRGPFPTSQRPVLDLSVYEGASHDSHEVSLYRAEGVAADGVASIAFLRPTGTVALRVPVNANVYEANAVPNGPIAGLAAYDAAGKELWRSP